MSTTLVHYHGQPGVIQLDPAIRNWVLVPIFTIMVLVGILRHYITAYFTLSSSSSSSSSSSHHSSTSVRTGTGHKCDWPALRQTNAIHRSIGFRRHVAHIPPPAVANRRSYFIHAFRNRTYLKNPKTTVSSSSPSPSPANTTTNGDDVPPLPDLSMMDGLMAAMKQNLATIVPQSLIMAFINAYFSGFLLIKLPFPLTIRFKSMLQSGILTPDLDAAWVSSLSWYFLNLFGLGPIFQLILGQDNAADGAGAIAAMNPMAASMASTTSSTSTSDAGDVPLPEMPMSANMGAMMMPGMPGNDSGYEKTFDSEADYLQLLNPDAGQWVGTSVEARVIALLQQRGC